MNYALITGASMGLGRAFAIELARRGYSLILVSLPNEGLERVAVECRFVGVECVTFETDLTKRECLLTLAEEVSTNYRLCLLINNAGVGGSREFASSRLGYIDTILKLNILASTLLTHQLLPNLKRQPKAYILNISSMASFTPTGFKTVYPASKEFLRHFSIGLREELRGSSVSVSVAILGPMPTRNDIIRRIEAQGTIGQFLTLQTETAARVCIDQLLKGKPVIVVGWSNRVSRFLLRFIPLEIRVKLMTKAVKRELR